MRDTNNAYRQAQKRLLLLDYDGTLVNFKADPSMAPPTGRLLRLLHKLIADPHNQVVIISGRDQLTMDQWLGDLDAGLAAEHGAFLKPRGGSWQQVAQLRADWLPEAIALMEEAMRRLPSSFIERKITSLAWHYRKANPSQARHIQTWLLGELADLARTQRLSLLDGHKTIELKPRDYNKATAAAFWLNQRGYDFILAAGDDITDEDMFAALPKTALSYKVGPDQTIARQSLPHPSALLELLESL